MKSNFTPLEGIIGGLLIGLSAVILLLGNGDILGASGIASFFIRHPFQSTSDPDRHWIVIFLSSFIITSITYVRLIDSTITTSYITTTNHAPMVSSLGYAIAGVLVGLGSKLANGCTSGHGICGMARFSRRSFIAVGTFMATGILTGSFTSSRTPYIRTKSTVTVNETCLILGIALVIIDQISLCMSIPVLSKPIKKFLRSDSDRQIKHNHKPENREYLRKISAAILAGVLFSVGLAISGMVLNTKVISFLNFSGMVDGSWDGTLAFVMGAGLFVSVIGYQFVPYHSLRKHKRLLQRPLLLREKASFSSVPTSKMIDIPLVLGSGIFGVGWAIAGVCPGPAIFLFASGVPQILAYWWPSYLAGILVADLLEAYVFARESC